MSKGLTLFDTPFVAGAGNTDWASRVVANGGAYPSATTINAMEAFRLGLVSAGLDTKIRSLCVFVPDSLIAALTPLIKTIGNDPWTNHNFVTGDLTVEGLKGDASSKYLDTGVTSASGQAFNSSTKDCGLTAIITETDGNASSCEIGVQTTSPSALLQLSSEFTLSGVDGNSAFWCKDIAFVNTAYTPDWNRTGYFSGNNVSGTSSIYVANPLVPHVLLTSKSVTATPMIPGANIYAFCSNQNGSPVSYSAKRLSLLAIHYGFTITESAAFAGLIQTLRTSLGGGTGDPIVNWAARVVSLGGAAPAAGTQTALRTFYSGLVSNSILAKMVTVNCVVPDNLTAARLPLIWGAGNELWTNHNFVSGDLGVNGLTGNGSSKYLEMGIIPSTVVTGGFSATSAGLSEMIYNVPTSATMYETGSGGSAGSSHFALIHFSGNGGFYCWSFAGSSGTNFVSAALPSTTWPGFLSGNRTASNAIAIYRASTANAFATLTSGVGAQTGAPFSTYGLTDFALNGVGTISNYSNRTDSFKAVHAGLNSTEAQALYNAVVTLRTALGGGTP